MEDLSFVAAQYRLDLRSAFRLFDLIELGGERGLTPRNRSWAIGLN